MNKLTDWNCRLLPHIANEGSVLAQMWERLHLDRFYFSLDYNATKESVAAFRIRLDKLAARLKQHDPTFPCRAYASVLLTPDISREAALLHLARNKGTVLPLLLPIGAYEDWIDTELNHLLYQRHITPLFLSVESSVVFYPDAAIERLLRIPGAIYQFSYKSLQERAICRAVSHLLQIGSTVLLGTSINAPEKIGYYELDDYLDAARANLFSFEFDDLMKQNRAFRLY